MQTSSDWRIWRLSIRLVQVSLVQLKPQDSHEYIAYRLRRSRQEEETYHVYGLSLHGT